MRVALVTHKLSKNDGQGRVNYEVASALLVAGNQLILLCEECAPEIAAQPGVTVVLMRSRVPSRLLRDLVFAWKSRRWLLTSRNSYDLSQANGFVTFARTTIVAAHFIHTAWLRGPAYPFRWFDFSAYSLYQRLYSVTHAFLEKRAFRNAQIVIAVSESVAQDLRAIGVAAESIRTVHNGVDLKEFCPGPPERERFGLPPGPPIALFIGDLMTPRKNLETVLKAVQMVPEIHLAIVGKGDAKQILVKGSEYGMAERITFLGRTTETVLLMRSVDVLVMPSWYEPYGMVAVEALATDLPVIMSANVGAAASLGHVCRVIDAPYNTVELAEAMRECIQEGPGFRSGERRACAMQWSWEAMAENYLCVYGELYSSAKQ